MKTETTSTDKRNRTHQETLKSFRIYAQDMRIEVPYYRWSTLVFGEFNSLGVWIQKGRMQLILHSESHPFIFSHKQNV